MTCLLWGQLNFVCWLKNLKYFESQWQTSKSNRGLNKFHSERKEQLSEITPTSVTQGKTLYSNEAAFAAAHAIDRDLMTEAATETGNGAGWIKLDFGKTYLIHKVITYRRFYINWYHPSDWCTQSEYNFRACVDKHNNVDVAVYERDVKQKSCGTLQLSYGLDQSDQIYTLICNTKGDTVILSKSTGDLAVMEVVVTSSGN